MDRLIRSVQDSLLKVTCILFILLCCCCATERYFLIFWPTEECYSEIIESKIVEPKDPAVGQTVKVKEGGKVFSGRVEAVGNKTEIERQLSELENTALVDAGEDKSADAESANNTKKGELSYLFIISINTYMYIHESYFVYVTMFTTFVQWKRLLSQKQSLKRVRKGDLIQSKVGYTIHQ